MGEAGAALIEAGHRVITYDRRGFGRSSQPWGDYDFDTLAADLDALLTTLDLRDVTLVGFSMGGGEVARYIGTYGTERVAAAVFAGAVPPYIHKTEDNPDGWLDDATVAQFRDGVRSDRIAFLDGLFTQYFGVGERTDLVSEAMRAYHVDLAAVASPKATLDCIESFAYTDFRADMDEGDGADARAPQRRRRAGPVRGQRQAHPRAGGGQPPGARRGRAPRLQHHPRRGVQRGARRLPRPLT